MGVSLVVLVVAAVTVSFDGLSESTAHQTCRFGVGDPLGVGPMVSVLTCLAGLFAFVGSFALAAVAALATGWVVTACRFAPTVVTIAAAYELGHDYPFVLRNVGQLLTVALEFVGGGGTAIPLLGGLSVPAFWGSQVLHIVGGHAVIVVAAHRVAVGRCETLTVARRGTCRSSS